MCVCVCEYKACAHLLEGSVEHQVERRPEEFGQSLFLLPLRVRIRLRQNRKVLKRIEDGFGKIPPTEGPSYAKQRERRKA